MTTYSLHPGAIASDVWREVPFGLRQVMKLFMKSTEQGARTSLYCATSPDVAGQTGRYYDNQREKAPSKVVTPELADRAVGAQRGLDQGILTEDLRRQVRDRAVAVEAHGQVGLGEQALEHVLGAGGAGERDAPAVGPADADRRRTEGERLDHVDAGADAGVEQHRHPLGSGDDAGEEVDRRGAGRLPATMVGAVDAVDAAVPGAAYVVGVADALEQQWQLGEAAQPRQVVPGERRVAEAHRPGDRRGAGVLLGRLLEAAAEHRVAEVVGQAQAAQLGERGVPQVARTPAERPGVEGDHDAGVPGGLGAADEALRELAVVRRVELVEAGGVARARAATSSIGSCISVEITAGTPDAAAARATSRSPCWLSCITPITPIGAMNRGVG